METLGTLELKINRLQQRLTILTARQVLSHPYPHYQAALAQAASQVSAQIDDLYRRRERLRHLICRRLP